MLKQEAANCRASIERLASSGDPLKAKAADEIQSELEPDTVVAASLSDGFGLFRPEERTRPAQLRADLAPQIHSTRAEGLLKSLDQVVEAHRETAVTIKTPNWTDHAGTVWEPEVVPAEAGLPFTGSLA